MLRNIRLYDEMSKKIVWSSARFPFNHNRIVGIYVFFVSICLCIYIYISMCHSLARSPYHRPNNTTCWWWWQSHSCVYACVCSAHSRLCIGWLRWIDCPMQCFSTILLLFIWDHMIFFYKCRSRVCGAKQYYSMYHNTLFFPFVYICVYIYICIAIMIYVRIVYYDFVFSLFLSFYIFFHDFSNLIAAIISIHLNLTFSFPFWQ